VAGYGGGADKWHRHEGEGASVAFFKRKWSRKRGHRHGASGLKTEAEGEKMGWGSGPSVHVRRGHVAVGKRGHVCGGKALAHGPRRLGGWWATGPASPMHSDIFYLIQNVQTELILIRSKAGLPLLENFQIKYGFEGFEERNNFPYRNFLIFEVDLN
jgi:hypothetical protein